MTELDIDRFVEGVRLYTARAVAPLADRIKALEAANAAAQAAVGPQVQAAIDARMSGAINLAFEANAENFAARAALLMAGTSTLRGKDGLSVDDFDLALDDDGRTVRVILRTAEREVVRTLTLPTIVDRGVHKFGQAYAQGDAVTYGRALWIARQATTEAPADRGGHWRLVLKGMR